MGEEARRTSTVSEAAGEVRWARSVADPTKPWVLQHPRRAGAALGRPDDPSSHQARVAPHRGSNADAHHQWLPRRSIRRSQLDQSC